MQNKRTKVLLCSPLDKSGVGGIAKWTKYIMDYSKSNCQFIDLEHFYPQTKTKGATSSLKRILNGIKNYFPLLSGLKKILKMKSFDVVHFSTSASVSLIKDILSINIAHKNGVKAVTHFHFGRIPQIYKNNNWERRLIDIVIHKSDATITMDRASYDTLTKQGYKNIYLLPNPLSLNVSDIIEQNKFIKREPRTIVFAGHVIKTKGVFELVKACKDFENIKLCLYGKVTEQIRGDLQKEAGDNYNSWLEIKGECCTEDVIRAMLSAGMFVLPTYTEGFPNVIIESMACGCPIVTTSVGAIPEMLDINGMSNCGICVPPRNVEKLKNAIQLMLDDSRYALQCGYNARKRVNDLYAMNIVWEKLSQIWQTTI